MAHFTNEMITTPSVQTVEKNTIDKDHKYGRRRLAAHLPNARRTAHTQKCIHGGKSHESGLFDDIVCRRMGVKWRTNRNGLLCDARVSVRPHVGATWRGDDDSAWAAVDREYNNNVAILTHSLRFVHSQRFDCNANRESGHIFHSFVPYYWRPCIAYAHTNDIIVSHQTIDDAMAALRGCESDDRISRSDGNPITHKYDERCETQTKQ